MYEATLRIRGAGAYAAATDGGEARIELWCDDHGDLLFVRGDARERVVANVEALVGVRDRVAKGGETVLVTEECLRRHHDATVERYLHDHDCLLLPPLRYARGAKVCRVLALDPANLASLYRDLTDEFGVTVAEKRELDGTIERTPLPGLRRALSALTERQREVFRAAHAEGYYRIPRETTTAALAERFGVERRTAEEHLRRAENKVVAALFEGGPR